MLTKEYILTLSKPKLHKIEVEGWTEPTFVRSLSVSQREGYIKSLQSKDYDGKQAQLVAMSLCNERGDPIFTMEDLPLVEQLAWDIIQKIATFALEVNGFFEDSEKKSNDLDGEVQAPAGDNAGG